MHVLGLPLAFILSQDQTLHCIYKVVCVLFLLSRSTIKTHSSKKLKRSFFPFQALASSFQRTYSQPFSHFQLPLSNPFCVIGSAKLHPFSYPPNIYLIIFHLFYKLLKIISIKLEYFFIFSINSNYIAKSSSNSPICFFANFKLWDYSLQIIHQGNQPKGCKSNSKWKKYKCLFKK